MEKRLSPKNSDRLLATHIANNKEFENACYAGDSHQIVSIIEAEMQKNKLFTKGSEKLKNDILRMLQGKEKVSYLTGVNILMFVWNSQAKGIGLAVN